MKKYKLLLVSLCLCSVALAQNKRQEISLPCVSDADADKLPGQYFNHTQLKYPKELTASSPSEKVSMLNVLNALEKLEEKSRTNFSVNGCVLQVSYANHGTGFFDGNRHTRYGYQLAAYRNVCHVTEHVTKTVGEYRTVFRVEANDDLSTVNFYSGSGDFFITDRSVRYDILVNINDNKIKAPSHIGQFISQHMVAPDPKNFDKINNGEGYIEQVIQNPDSKVYQWFDRNWYITKPGMPLLVRVTRKEYLQALLEFYEIEKVNFAQEMGYKINSDSRSNSPDAKKRMAIYEADKIAYQKIYETKKAKVTQLLASQKEDWLQKTAIMRTNQRMQPLEYNKPSNGLLDFEKFEETEKDNAVLYKYNPEYFKANAQQPWKPMFFHVQFRHEFGMGYSERFFNNFMKNFDFDALRKMLE